MCNLDTSKHQFLIKIGKRQKVVNSTKVFFNAGKPTKTCKIKS